MAARVGRHVLPADRARRMKLSFRHPALLALLLQFASAALVVAASAFLEVRAGLSLSLLALALLQGALAGLLSALCGLPRWWQLIQFVLPPALVAASALQLPPAIYLAGFLFVLALYWTTFRTRVPFFPSSLPTWEAVARLLPQDRSVRMVDLGSGMGGLVLHLSDVRPDSLFSGVESAPLPWLISYLRAKARHSNAHFIRADYHALNLAEYDVVFAFLSPAAMPAVWQKAQMEMRAGSLLLSYEFGIPGAVPELSLPPDRRGARLFAWRMTGAASEPQPSGLPVAGA